MLSMLHNAIANYNQNRDQKTFENGTLSHHKLVIVHDYIEAHLNEKINLNDLASSVCLSPYHFNRVYKNTTGVCPHQYVLDRRIRLARELLRYNKLDICEVALNCGFSSQSHLTEWFTRRLGVTPKQYKKVCL